MVTCYQQYSYHYLYLYTIGKQLCHYGYTECYSNLSGNNYVYTCRANMFRCCTECTTGNIEQWHYRNMVTCYQQYSNHYLYLYTIGKQLCHYGYTECYSKC